MQSREESSSLLAEAISAIGDAAFEDAYLQWLRSCLAINSVTAIVYFQNKAPDALLLWSDNETTHSMIYHTYLLGAYQIDPLYALHAKVLQRGAYRLSDIAPDQFFRTEYYTSYYKFTGIIDEVGLLARPKEGVTIVVSLSRDGKAKRRFSQMEMRQIRSLCPIATALAESHWQDLTAGREKKDSAPVHIKLIQSLQSEHDISLSPRQAEVALLVLMGHSSVSIGLKLGISQHTVRVFRKQIYKKCNISSQSELFRLLLPLL
ncbi:MAG: helix-turn-helix transcriptional regulator [Pseudomonadota bacterium]